MFSSTYRRRRNCCPWGLITMEFESRFDSYARRLRDVSASASAPLENWLHLINQNIEGTEATQRDCEGARGVWSTGAEQEGHAPTSQSPQPRLSVKGAPAKVGKKRTRASRQTPTTILRTDASNFKAMVQKFTGFSEPPFVGSAPSLDRWFPDVASPPSMPPRPQQYHPSFPLLLSRCPSEGQPHAANLFNDVGLNAAVVSNGNPMMLSSELQERYLVQGRDILN